jgi:hypothetical protein
MVRIVLVFLLAIVWLATACFAQAGQTQNNLIPVKPGFDNPTSVPPPTNSDGPELPKPSDQLYVFWYLGQIISYPIDTAETYIRSYIAKLRQPPQPVAVPASSTPMVNPFDSVKWNAIPPAPPVAGGGR